MLGVAPWALELAWKSPSHDGMQSKPSNFNLFGMRLTGPTTSAMVDLSVQPKAGPPSTNLPSPVCGAQLGIPQVGVKVQIPPAAVLLGIAPPVLHCQI